LVAHIASVPSCINYAKKHAKKCCGDELINVENCSQIFYYVGALIYQEAGY